jgi:peptidoglycan/xylan/chitin deacetylase (PgdA/CDA1 family)
MKAVMYHYVRPDPVDMPHFKHVNIENFRRQLDWLQASFGFVTRDQFEMAIDTADIPRGVILTFDDAFTDHADYVLPELQRRGLWAIFYIPTAVLRDQKPLDVHLLHLILGRHGGTTALAALNAVITDDMLIDRWRDEFRTKTYVGLDHDAATMEFKRILNYYISYDHQADAVRAIASTLAANVTTDRIYMTPDQIVSLHRAGMTIGAHTVNHVVLSKLSPDQQRREIEQSFRDLQDIIGEPVTSFCYPYGGFHTFTDETRSILRSLGCRHAFNVEPRDIEVSDLGDCMALPRYDCNAFPFGRPGPMS